MSDTEPQTADGKVLWHFMMSLDGFVAGPNHEMDWMTGTPSVRPERGVRRNHGSRAGGRDGWDVINDAQHLRRCLGPDRPSCSPTTPRTRGPPTESRS